MTQRTFAMVKPDGVQRGLVGEIISRYEDRGLKLVALKTMQVPRELAEEHYTEHEGKPFYEPLVEYITSSPVVCMVLEGTDAVKVVRSINGATDPVEAHPGTIRGDHAVEIGRNVVHGADSPKSAERETGIYFDQDDLLDYERVDETWLTE